MTLNVYFSLLKAFVENNKQKLFKLILLFFLDCLYVVKYLYYALAMRKKPMFLRRYRKKTMYQQMNNSTIRVADECNPETMSQQFQVSVNVIEAKKLAWSNANHAASYVILAIGKKKLRTSVRKNMEEPCFKEQFLFELNTTERELQKTNLWVAVMESKCYSPARMMGEANIGLGAIWIQPNHEVLHKWVQLTLPNSNQHGPHGFLKVDISVLDRLEKIHDVANKLVTSFFQESILLPVGSEQQHACYAITIHGAFGLPNSSETPSDRRKGKPPNSFVRVSFCGLTAKTIVQHRTNNPIYSEQISFAEMFPNVNQLIKFEVFATEGYYTKLLANTQLDMQLVSHDGDNGFLPTFGPSLLHMYSSSNTMNQTFDYDDGPYHRGSLLVTLQTFVPYSQQSTRSVLVEPSTQLVPENLWQVEDFCLYCPLLEVSMVDKRLIGENCGIAISMADIPSDRYCDEEFQMMMEEFKTRKLHYTGSVPVVNVKPDFAYISFKEYFPVLQLALTLPDFRFRMYRDNMVRGIINELTETVNDAESRLLNYQYDYVQSIANDLNVAVDDAAGNIVKYLDILQYSGSNSNSVENLSNCYNTLLDQKQLELQQEEITKILNNITNKAKENSHSYLAKSCSSTSNERVQESRKYVKMQLIETKCLISSLQSIVYKNSDGWPSITVWLINEGSRVAYCKIPPREVIYSVIPEQSGEHCGKIQNIFLKPLKCPRHISTSPTACMCVSAKVEICMWMGLYRQRGAFDYYLPPGFKLRMKEFYMYVTADLSDVECRVFIYKAKLNTPHDKSFVSPYVRINALNLVKETKVKSKTLVPTWNQIVKLQNILYTTRQRLLESPPAVLVEVLDSENSRDLIGRTEVHPILDDRSDYEFAPKLQWFDIHKGTEITGKILMSLQLLLIPEKLLKTVMYQQPYEEALYAQSQEMEKESETLPLCLVPQNNTYKVDVYWWGLRKINLSKNPCVVIEMDELKIKSETLANINKNSNYNFANARTSVTIEAPLTGSYKPPISVKLYDSGTFGRTVFLAANDVKKSSKFFVQWLPKYQRDSNLRTQSINSDKFIQISQTVFMVKTTDYFTKKRSDIVKNNSFLKSISSTKKPRWRNIFGKTLSEDEYSLLPVFNKSSYLTNSEEDLCLDGNKEESWWTRFNKSQEDSEDVADKITIYDSELELRPEFSKFRDWCSLIKLYSGKKTGIPEQDEQILCGLLKVGIAIYKWPPPEKTVAVSSSGVELNSGSYFDEYPSNGESSYLVRVYVVKGELNGENAKTNRDPYVVVGCGKKNIGDRNKYVPKTVNPLFGSMYEFHCGLPEDYSCNVSVYDYDVVPPDKLIGSTSIDLEDRIYTRHRATVGLCNVYRIEGANKWRDGQNPSDILHQLCVKNHISPPLFPDENTVILNGYEFKDTNKDLTMTSSERRENICLNLLHDWNSLPLCGYSLVPEHVETRSLYHPEIPGIPQGKLWMWLDIFQVDTGQNVPAATDISTSGREEYELVVIVKTVKGICVDVKDLNAGNKGPNVYVKVWLGSEKYVQYTDIHENVPKNCATFNWRMMFPVSYDPTEKRTVHVMKNYFTEVEEKHPLIMILQVVNCFDDDRPDKIIGQLNMNLNKMHMCMKTAELCSQIEDQEVSEMDFFDTKISKKKGDKKGDANQKLPPTKKMITGWWPLKAVARHSKEVITKGAIELELQLVPVEEAIANRVGTGRQPPEPLQPPRRQPYDYYRNVTPKYIFQKYGFAMTYTALATLALIICYILLDAFGILEFIYRMMCWIRAKISIRLI